MFAIVVNLTSVSRNEVLDAELSRCLEALLFQITPFLIRPYAPRLMDSVIPSNLSRTTNVRLKVSSTYLPTDMIHVLSLILRRSCFVAFLRVA